MTTPGAVIVARRPPNPIGWIFCAIGLTQGVTGFANEYGHYALLTNPGSLPGGVAALMATIVWVVLFGAIPLLVLLFPDGQLPSRRWRPLVWVVAAATVVLLGSQLVAPGPARSLSRSGHIDGPRASDCRLATMCREPTRVDITSISPG